MSSSIDQYFSIVALFIIFRETIEASIIVSVLLQFLHRSFPQLKKQVWWGVAMGILLSAIFGVIFSIVFYVAKQNVFTGNNKAIFKGAIAWFAGILITILAFAMLRYRGWEDKIKRKLEALAQKELERQANGGVDPDDVPPEGRLARMSWSVRRFFHRIFSPAGRAFLRLCSRIDDVVCACLSSVGHCFNVCILTLTRPCRKGAPPAVVDDDTQKAKPVSELVGDHEAVVISHSHGIGIFTVVFATVLREGVESVVFLAGVGNASPSSIPLAGLVGFVCGVLVGVFLFYTGKQVKDIRFFIIFMAVVLLFIAGGQFMLGTDFLITAGMFGYASPWVNDRPWYMQPQWDFSSCCADTDQNKFFALSRAIFGYQDKPTFVELCVYFGYWLLVIAAATYKWYTGSLFDADYKYKRQQAKLAKLAAAGALPQDSMVGPTGQLSAISIGAPSDDKGLDLEKAAALAKAEGVSKGSGESSPSFVAGADGGDAAVAVVTAPAPAAPATAQVELAPVAAMQQPEAQRMQ